MTHVQLRVDQDTVDAFDAKADEMDMSRAQLIRVLMIEVGKGNIRIEITARQGES